MTDNDDNDEGLGDARECIPNNSLLVGSKWTHSVALDLTSEKGLGAERKTKPMDNLYRAVVYDMHARHPGITKPTTKVCRREPAKVDESGRLVTKGRLIICCHNDYTGKKRPLFKSKKCGVWIQAYEDEKGVLEITHVNLEHACMTPQNLADLGSVAPGEGGILMNRKRNAGISLLLTNDGITQTSKIATTEMEELSGRNSHKHNTGAKQTFHTNMQKEGKINITPAQLQKMNTSRAAGSLGRIQESLPFLPALFKDLRVQDPHGVYMLTLTRKAFPITKAPNNACGWTSTSSSGGVIIGRGSGLALGGCGGGGGPGGGGGSAGAGEPAHFGALILCLLQ